MAFYYPSHSPSLVPSHIGRSGAGWGRRLSGILLVLYLMPVILVVVAIGAVGLVAGRGWRLLRSRG